MTGRRVVVLEAVGGVALLVVALLVAVGSRGARSAVLDGGAWVDYRSGSVHVDGASGVVDGRLVFPCQTCRWVQRDGVTLLYVWSTGELRRLDAAALALPRGPVVGVGAAAEADVVTDVVTGGGRVYVIDRSTGVVKELDRRSLEEVAQVELGGRSSRGVVDDEGRLWVVSTSAGQVVRIADGSVEVTAEVAGAGDDVELAGVGDRLVALDVTRGELRVVGPAGAVGPSVRYGSPGPVKVARQLESKELWLVDGSDSLVSVDLDAGTPTRPVSLRGGPDGGAGPFLAPVPYQGRVYVGSNEDQARVLRFDAELGSLGEPLLLTKGPVVVFEKDGYLYVNGKEGRGLVIDRSGEPRQIDKGRADVPIGDVEGSTGITPLEKRPPTQEELGEPLGPTSPRDPTGTNGPGSADPGPPGDPGVTVDPAAGGGAPGAGPPATSPPGSPSSSSTTAPPSTEPTLPTDRAATDVPGKPTGVRATVAGTQVTVTWTAPAGGADTYSVATVDGSVAYRATAGNGSCSSVSNTCVITGLVGTHAFTVQGQNTKGDGPKSDPSNTVTIGSTSTSTPTVDPPGAPGNLFLSFPDGNTARATWSPPATGGAVEGYRFTRAGAQATTLGPAQTSVDFAVSCPADAQIDVSVLAFNSGGDSPAATQRASVNCTPPAAVTLSNVRIEVDQGGRGLTVPFTLAVQGFVDTCSLSAQSGGPVGGPLSVQCPGDGQAVSPSSGVPLSSTPNAGATLTLTVSTTVGGGSGPSDSKTTPVPHVVDTDQVSGIPNLRIVDCVTTPASSGPGTYGSGGQPVQGNPVNFSGAGSLPQCSGPPPDPVTGFQASFTGPTTVSFSYTGSSGISGFTCYVTIEIPLGGVVGSTVDYPCPSGFTSGTVSASSGITSGAQYRIVLHTRDGPDPLASVLATAP